MLQKLGSDLFSVKRNNILLLSINIFLIENIIYFSIDFYKQARIQVIGGYY